MGFRKCVMSLFDGELAKRTLVVLFGGKCGENVAQFECVFEGEGTAGKESEAPTDCMPLGTVIIL